MIKEDCLHLCEVISSGEKVKACRQDDYTVTTYFSCSNCNRYDHISQKNDKLIDEKFRNVLNKEIKELRDLMREV